MGCRTWLTNNTGIPEHRMVGFRCAPYSPRPPTIAAKACGRPWLGLPCPLVPPAPVLPWCHRPPAPCPPPRSPRAGPPSCCTTPRCGRRWPTTASSTTPPSPTRSPARWAGGGHNAALSHPIQRPPTGCWAPPTWTGWDGPPCGSTPCPQGRYRGLWQPGTSSAGHHGVLPAAPADPAQPAQPAPAALQVSPSQGEQTWPYQMTNGIPQNCSTGGLTQPYLPGVADRHAERQLPVGAKRGCGCNGRWSALSWPQRARPSFPQCTPCLSAAAGSCSPGESYPGLWEIPLWSVADAQQQTIASMDPEGNAYDNYKREVCGGGCVWGLCGRWFRWAKGLPETVAHGNGCRQQGLPWRRPDQLLLMSSTCVWGGQQQPAAFDLSMCPCSWSGAWLATAPRLACSSTPVGCPAWLSCCTC